MQSEVDKGAVSAAWGVVAVVLGGAAVAVWLTTVSPGSKVPAWPTWVLSVSTVLAIYLCFAPVFGIWPAGRRGKEKTGHETVAEGADGALQVMSGSPGAIQAGAGARIRTRDVIIMNPPIPGSGRDEEVEAPKASSG